MIYYKHTTIFTLAFSLALSCIIPATAAMQQPSVHEQKKEDQKQLSLRQTAMPILEQDFNLSLKS